MNEIVNHEVKAKSRNRHPDRIKLEPEILAVIESHIEQVKVQKKGVRLSRKDYVAWRLKRMEERLSEAEVAELSSHFYDQERYLLELLKEVREAKARGAVLVMELNERPIPQTPKDKRKRRAKVPFTEEKENTSSVEVPSGEGIKLPFENK